MSLTPYLPADRLLALLAGRELPDRAIGVALFADLAGFTHLAESLAHQLGPQRGAEELTYQLGRVYAVLVGEVDRFAGSVVAFSGDAITCWFDGPHDAALRAVAAALAMQQGIRALAPVSLLDGTALPLGIKVALAGGPIRRLAIGDPYHGRLDVLAGATLDLLGAIEQHTSRDEVLIDADTARAIASHLRLAEWRAIPATDIVAARISTLATTVPATPWPHPPRSPAVEDLARPWVLPVVADRIEGGSGDVAGSLLAELRRAVALFLGFRGINYDADDDAPRQLDAFVRRVQAVAAAYEAALLQLTMGDKGSYLYLAFGAPVAQADAAANAVAAAYELADLPHQLSFIEPVRIGIARGQMYCGDYGAPTRRTYGVLGDATNVAARLMSLAPPGGIRCDEGIYQAARRRWAFAELPPIPLKGKRDPVPVYTPVGPAGPALARAPDPLPLGRAAELARLDGLVEQLRGGAGGVLSIVGEAGVGKSLLAGALSRRAAGRGCLTLMGAARSNEQQTPYRAWRDLLGAFFDLDGLDDPAAQRERVLQTVAATAPRLAVRSPLLNDVLHLGLAEMPLTATLDARLRQESLRELITTLLRERLREAPLLLLLEDAQWLDALSWQLTVGVARTLLAEGAPLLLSLVHRPAAEGEPHMAHLAALHALPRAETMLLEGLDDGSVNALAAQRLGLDPSQLPDPVAALLRERAAGNPFFVEELVDNLRDSGLIRVDPAPGAVARCLISPELSAGRVPLPETVESLVLARIDRLPAAQQPLLKVAAVIGRSFGETPLLATVRRYSQIDRPVLRDYLDGFSRRNLTLVEATEPEGIYAFKHSITHRVAYETLLFGQRAEIHGAVAAWYEATYADRIDAFYALLAYHYQQAGDRAGEARYARLAGAQASALYANDNALAYLSRALELTPATDLGERFDLLLRRERVYDVLARREEQAADVRALEALAERLADDGLRAQAALRRSSFAERVSDFATCAQAAARAASLAVARRDVTAEAHARQRWGTALWKLAQYEPAHEQIEGALAIARAWALPAVEAEALFMLGSIAVSKGSERGAQPLFEAALAIYRELGNRRSEGNCVTALSVIASFTGDYARSRDLNYQALEIFRAVGDRSGEAFALNNLADDHMAFGDFPAARTSLAESLAIFRSIGSWEGEGWALHLMGDLAVALGDYGEARGAYKRALAIFQALESAEDESNALRCMGMAAHLAGDDGTALSLSEAAERITRSIGYARGRGYALTVMGHALLALGRLDEAAAAYDQARAVRAAMDEPALLLETMAGLARVALARGAVAEAVAAVEPILAHLAGAPMTGADEPARVELTCYEALSAAGDPRAAGVLAAAAARLLERAARITDPGTRRSFLTAVKAHQALLALWETSGRVSPP